MFPQQKSILRFFSQTTIVIKIFPDIHKSMKVFGTPISQNLLQRNGVTRSLQKGISGRRGGEVQTKHRRRDIQHRASV